MNTPQILLRLFSTHQLPSPSPPALSPTSTSQVVGDQPLCIDQRDMHCSQHSSSNTPSSHDARPPVLVVLSRFMQMDTNPLSLPLSLIARVDNSGGACWTRDYEYSFCKFEGNRASSRGGAVFDENEGRIQFCAFLNNQAPNDRDWYCATVVGCTRSEDVWEGGTGLIFVTGNGEGEECSPLQPCRSLTSAVSTALTIGVDTIHVGEGKVGAVTLPTDFGTLTIRPHFDFKEGRTNTPSSSFSITCEQGSGADLNSLSLSPLPGMPLLRCGLDSHSSHIKECRINSVKGVSAPLFAISDEAQLALDQVFFENISQVSSALISVKDSAVVTLSNVLFRQIETTHSLIVVTTAGSCSISQSLIHTVTRSEGEGAAAIDVTDCHTFSLYEVTFSHCISKEGKAGAITTDDSDPWSLYLNAFFLNNRGKDENRAHDIFVTGFDSEMVSYWLFSQVSSFSEFPQIIDGSDSPPTINVFYTISFAESQVPSVATLNNQPVLFLLDSPFIDLSRVVNQHNRFELRIKSTSEIPITIQPLALETQTVSIAGYSVLILQPFLSPPQTTGTLFTVSDSSKLALEFLFHILKSELTEPLITVTTESEVTLSNCAFTSDGGVHSAPLVLSSSSFILVYDTNVYGFVFANHSCFEGDGGYFSIGSNAYYSSAVIANITTTGDGAALNFRNAEVMFNSAHFFDCHARNGGVASLHNCQISLYTMLAMRCSAESKGGALFVHSVDSTARIGISPTLIECSAELGGGIFLDVSHFRSLSLSNPGTVSVLAAYRTGVMFSNCFAVKGGGAYLDGDWSNIGSASLNSLTMSNGGPLVCGQDLFFSQPLAESFTEFEQFLQNMTEWSWSMSTMSSDDASQYKQVEAEGHPEWSLNLDCPKIVLIVSEYPSFTCISEKKSQSSSLNDYLPLLHLKDENNEFRQIPIFLRDKVYFFQTGVLMEQSIFLTPEALTDPVPSSTLSFGSDYWKEDRFFVRLEREGRVEIANVQFSWGIDLGLCEVVDRSGTAKIASCHITLSIALSHPFLSCSAGTLIISQSTFTTTDPSPLTVPLVCSSPLSSFACNSATDQIRIEMDGVHFSNLNVEESVDGVVQLEGVDSLRLKNVEFSNVKNGTLDAVRIVVVGTNLFETIESVQTSGFPARGTELDGLYKSLDISEPVPSNYRSPTLLLYLNAFNAETVIVSGTGRDGMWCGDAEFPCRSLNEADKHLNHAIPSTIEVQTSAVLKSYLDHTQDITKIASGTGEKGQVDVSKEGCLNQADIHTHSLTLDSLVFSLTSDRTKSLLISQSGSLIMTSCSFASSSSSALTSKLVEVKGGSIELHKVELSSLAFTDTLLSFSSFVSVELHTVTHKSCSPHPLMTFDGKSTTSSTVEIRDCVFKGISSSESNEEPLCEWDTGLVILTNCSLEGFTSTFSHISQGALRVVDSVVSLKQSLFEVNGPRHSSFPSLNWNIGCFGKSEIELESSSTTDLSSFPNWISTSDECVVKRGDSSIVPHPFFIPTLSIDNCSSKLDQKSKNYEVSISGSTLIPCGLVLVVEEVTDKVEGKNVTIPVNSTFSTVLNDTSISLTLPESSFTQLDAKLAWNAFLAFGNDGRTDSFVFKRTAKAIRAEAMGKTLPWLIPLIVVICVLILVALVVIFLCRRRRTAGQTTKMSEMKEEDTVQVDEKVEVDQGTQLGVHANEAVDPLSKQSNMETLPEQQQSSEVPFSDGLVEALCCGGKLEMTVVREQDSLYNMLHVQKEKKTTIVKRVIERQLAQGLEAVANASLDASILTRLSSHWVMFDSNGRVCLKMHDTEPTPSLPNQPQKRIKANVSQEAQRWKAPEVVKAEEGQISHQPTQQEIDTHRAAVFSLGLVLWEIETGSVPFAEQDATNAQRQLGTGAHPKMEGVGPKMQELIVDCLALDPNERPELSEVYSFLLTVDGDDTPDENEAHSHP